MQPGQQVEAILDAYPEWRIPAAVRTVIPTADRQKATVKVRIAFDALDPRILPDMGVKVAFLAERAAGRGRAGGAWRWSPRRRCARTASSRWSSWCATAGSSGGRCASGAASRRRRRGRWPAWPTGDTRGGRAARRSSKDGQSVR